MIKVHRKYGKSTVADVPSGTEVDGLADTGAQICTAGTDLLVTMGIEVDFLVPTRMGVKGVASSKVSVLGAL